MSDNIVPAQPVTFNDTQSDIEKEIILNNDFLKERIVSLQQNTFNIILPDDPQLVETRTKKK
ncbi:hypothetical protein JNUCC83_10800 [Vagococcus sp. JNUCC 83]